MQLHYRLVWRFRPLHNKIDSVSISIAHRWGYWAHVLFFVPWECFFPAAPQDQFSLPSLRRACDSAEDENGNKNVSATSGFVVRAAFCVSLQQSHTSLCTSRSSGGNWPLWTRKRQKVAVIDASRSICSGAASKCCVYLRCSALPLTICSSPCTERNCYRDLNEKWRLEENKYLQLI